MAALNARRRDLWGEHTDRLRYLVPAALDILAAGMESEDPKAQQAAAVHVLKAAGIYGGCGQPDGETNEMRLLLSLQ